MSSKTRFEALFSFGLAVLTDLLSIIIAWAFSNKRNSILYAANISELTRNKEETMEDCYTFICFNKLYNNSSFRDDLKNGKYSEMEHKIIDSLHIPIKEFMDNIQFHDFLPELNRCGYITGDYMKGILLTTSTPTTLTDSTTDKRLLFSALRDIGMLVPCSVEEANKLVIPEGNKVGLASGMIIFLVSKNFVQWYTENFSELLMNSTAIIDI